MVKMSRETHNQLYAALYSYHIKIVYNYLLPYLKGCYSHLKSARMNTRQTQGLARLGAARTRSVDGSYLGFPDNYLYLCNYHQKAIVSNWW